ncbi:MAG TPA: hypothetical protein VKQ36_03885 [Ktedonobacterales bacterium]|nr:hypothetical protein [Ktedonobacterales bacterium]
MRKIVVSEFMSLDGVRLNLRLVEARPLPCGVVLTHDSVEHMA